MKTLFFKDYFDSLGNALDRLSDALNKKDLDIDLDLHDIVIHRFEFCIELYWKVLKKILVYEKIKCSSPREVLEQAYQIDLINNEKAWLSMLDDRNKTSHLYSLEVSNEIFLRVKDHFPVMLKNYKHIQKKYFPQ